MVTITADAALLPDRWHEDVVVQVGDNGRINRVNSGVKAPSTRSHPLNTHVSHLLPAPVNVHSHAFQRAMAGLTEHRSSNTNDSFWRWRELMFRFLDKLTPDHVEAISAFAQMEMLEAGYATNVEFHYLHHSPDGSAYETQSEMADRIMTGA